MNDPGRPDRTEAAEYFFTYIDQVGGGDIRAILRSQLPETVTLLRGITEDRSAHRYAAGKWTIREVLAHVNDCERLFSFRALWFARGLGGELPSFDQDIAASNAGADRRPWSSHVDEFKSLREGTLALFDNLPDDAWTRSGIASGGTFTVRALAYIAAGHVVHHSRVLREKYL